jgi:hypothetical protein
VTCLSPAQRLFEVLVRDRQGPLDAALLLARIWHTPGLAGSGGKMNSMKPKDGGQAGRPLAVDRQADSAEAGVPAFVARPPDAPVYHGFRIIEGLTVRGFQLGMITDFLAAPDTAGDAFVVAPDGSRAGLVWESEVTEPYFQQLLPPEDDRWGVWAVGVTQPLRSVEDAREFLVTLLPELTVRWELWRRARDGDDPRN